MFQCVKKPSCVWYVCVLINKKLPTQLTLLFFNWRWESPDITVANFSPFHSLYQIVLCSSEILLIISSTPNPRNSFSLPATQLKKTLSGLLSPLELPPKSCCPRPRPENCHCSPPKHWWLCDTAVVQEGQQQGLGFAEFTWREGWRW